MPSDLDGDRSEIASRKPSGYPEISLLALPGYPDSLHTAIQGPQGGSPEKWRSWTRLTQIDETNQPTGADNHICGRETSAAESYVGRSVSSFTLGTTFAKISPAGTDSAAGAADRVVSVTKKLSSSSRDCSEHGPLFRHAGCPPLPPSATEWRTP